MTQKAELVFKNGFIYTADKNRSTAEAVAIADSKFVFIGSSADVEAYIDSNTEVIDLNGQLVMPSFFEGHAHVSKSVVNHFGCNLFGINTLEDYISALKEFLKEHPDFPAIRGNGWLEAVFPGTGPKKEDLDKVSTEIPIVCTSETLHSVWANSKALEMAGITKDTPDPKNGKIHRNEDGSPSGCLRESAQDLVFNVLPDFTVEQYKVGILAYQELAHKYGFNGVYDPWLDHGSNAIEAFKELEKENKLTMRYRGAYWINPERGLDQVEELTASRANDCNGELFKINGVKFFVDGIIESVTACLLEPYVEAEGKEAGYKGHPIWEAEPLNNMLAALDKEGFQLHSHAMGDAAVRATLDAVKFTQKQNGKRDARHTVTHAGLIDPNDIPRFKELGVVAMLNTYWAQIDDLYFMNGSFVGMDRADKFYPVNSLIKAGALVCSASDYPITAIPNPFIGIEIGVTRTAPDNYHPWIFDYSNSVFHKAHWPEEKASLPDMIDAFTINQACACFLEDETGSIEVGKSADMIVVDKNITEIPAEDIGTATVQMTLFKGKKV
ncbi:amidohydrolase [Phosphitispora sp. TUW77]|uniref:amidohydrolase n=1 Tax=Phosphitispora sp. TUW77 TaxID=3152361 RepID=UPI003AB63757